MMSPRVPALPLDPILLSLWRGTERLLLFLAAANLVGALVVKWLGAGLHPIFSDPDAALMFLVTGLGLLAHAAVLVALRWRLSAAGPGALRPLSRLRAFMRLPIHADFATQRDAARLRKQGRPASRGHSLTFRLGRRRRLP